MPEGRDCESVTSGVLIWLQSSVMFLPMTAKAQVLDLVQQLPDDASYKEIARKIELIIGIQEAREQMARGEGLTPEDVLKEMPTWLTRS